MYVWPISGSIEFTSHNIDIEFSISQTEYVGSSSCGACFASVRREESRRLVMIGKKSSTTHENCALNVTATEMAAAVSNPKSVNQPQWKCEEKAEVWCDYCDKPRHTREACWKLHGKPANWKGNRFGDNSGRVMQAAAETDSTPFSKLNLIISTSC